MTQCDSPSPPGAQRPGVRALPEHLCNALSVSSVGDAIKGLSEGQRSEFLVALQTEDREGSYSPDAEHLLSAYCVLRPQVLSHLFTLAFKRPLEPQAYTWETRWVLVPFDRLGFPDVTQRAAQACACSPLAQVVSRPCCHIRWGSTADASSPLHKAERSKH